MKRSNFRRHGGTSIADEEGSTIKWLAAAVGVGVVLVVGFILLSGNGDDVATDLEQQPASTAAESPPAEPRVAAIPAEGGSPSPDVPEAPSAEQSQVVADLEAELQSRRLWSSVEMDATIPSLIVVRSAYCNDAGVKQSVAKLTSRLRAQGVTRLECYERHGELVFDQDL